MSEITKMLVAGALITVGFFGASLFGPPTGDQDRSTAPNGWSQEVLQPLKPAPEGVQASADASRRSDFAGNWDSSVKPAGHATNNQFVARAGGEFTGQQAFSSPPTPDSWQPPSVATANPSMSAAAPTIRRQRPADELAMLAPPQLLPSDTAARSLRSSTFPTRPTANPNNVPSSFDNLARSRADSFSAPFDNTPSLFDQSERGSAQGSSEWGNGAWESATVAFPPVSPRSASKPIWHVVADGDSLAKLAERYLGDAHRAREIYEANREAITSPDLLPIGAELRIPSSASAAGSFDVFDASGSASTYTPQRRLTPLPDLPEATRLAPRARLQPPVSASLTDMRG